MSIYNTIAETNDYTIVAQYEHSVKTAEHYQSEAQLEKELIRMWGEQGYKHLTIQQEKDLIENLRKQLERLNNYPNNLF